MKLVEVDLLKVVVQYPGKLGESNYLLTASALHLFVNNSLQFSLIYVRIEKDAAPCT